MGGIISKIKSGVINTTANIISAPSQIRSYRVQKQSAEDAKAIKVGNMIKGKPIVPFDQSNPDFRTTMNAIGAKARTEARVARTAKK